MTTHERQRVQLSSERVVERYLSFFRARNHVELPGSPLVVPGSTTSFIIAGMQPLLPYLRGEQQPPAPRLTSFQRCLRTVDVEETGNTGRRLTCFHMLGNWSVGDYGKREAIEMALELLRQFQINLDKLWITVFAGDSESGLPPDEFTRDEWLRHGFPAERIVELGVEDNLWTMGGPGPCGPCTEIFLDQGASLGCGKSDCRPGCSCERFLEFWNLVFIEFERLPDGSLKRLPFLSVDTGMGLERVAMVLQHTSDAFDLDLFLPARQRLEEFTSSRDNTFVELRARRIILDHMRAALFAGLEGVYPGREGRNSVVRRLLRRALRQGRVLGIEGPFLSELLTPLAQGHAFLLSDLQRQQLPVLQGIFQDEERQFSRVLTSGLKQLAALEPPVDDLIPGDVLFRLQAERGFPTDLAAEILAERGLQVDWEAYERALEEHHVVSKVSAKKHFHRER